MNKRRLLKLADLLEADAKNKKGVQFDLMMWGQVEDPRKPLSCGTTACAMGLAAVSGAFKKQGLSYEVQLNGCLYISCNEIGGGFNSASELFSISSSEAHWLFDYPSYGENAIGTGAQGERMVATRIRNFVAGKETPLAIID